MTLRYGTLVVVGSCAEGLGTYWLFPFVLPSFYGWIFASCGIFMMISLVCVTNDAKAESRKREWLDKAQATALETGPCSRRLEDHQSHLDYLFTPPDTLSSSF